MPTLAEKLRILHFINEARWSNDNKEGRRPINLHPNFSTLSNQEEALLLTHALCYISNRQMNPNKVFQDGGYVYSYIVWDYYTNPPRSVIDILNGVFTTLPDGYRLKVSSTEFSSRFMPTDIVCIYKTLTTLDTTYKRSFADFIKTAISGKSVGARIDDLTEKLYDLIYSNVGTVKWAAILGATGKIDASKVAGIKSAKTTGFKRFEGSKRVWCTVRDYLRSQVVELSPSLTLKEAFRTVSGITLLPSDLEHLEVPGDLWNNNDTFKACFWGTGTKSALSGTGTLPKQIRDYWTGISAPKPFIPEDYDSTFYLVRRLCEINECKSICPFSSTPNHAKDMCHSTGGKLCPVVKVCSGYSYKCKNPNDCELKKLLL